MKETDAKDLKEAFELQGWNKSLKLFLDYYTQQENDEKMVIIAQADGNIAGYVILLKSAKSGPYILQEIPEIVDLNVLIKYRSTGVGNRLMDVAEKLASEFSPFVSLSVGLHNGYGSAQRMYVKRGYIPDGTGVWYKGHQLEQYVPCVNDDDLVLYMRKDLSKIK
jgi:ribosomal protein S18 acetylase RimI-like enzyme